MLISCVCSVILKSESQQCDFCVVTIKKTKKKSDRNEMATSQHFMPHRPTLGLLTTVAELPHNYKIRYITPESPLDLTVKPVLSPMTPPCTPSPARKRLRIDVEEIDFNSVEDEKEPIISDIVILPIKKEVTPKKPIKTVIAPRTNKVHPIHHTKDRKHKAVRKLKFDENKSSPVSGTIIRSLDDIEDDGVVMESGDIDPQYNIVEVTEEAKSEIAAIPNIIGSYACKLCRNEYEDAFGLARHKCSCIVLLEYRCPECGKRFNCPANLASHRRWHKPKDDSAPKKKENQENDQQFPCVECGKFFKRQAYLRKHMQTHKTKQKTSQLGPRNSESSGSYRSENSNSGDSTTSGVKRKAESDCESMLSGYSSMPQHFRLFEGAFTEEENIAAAALAHLRNGPSVIRHTALSV